VLKNAFFMLVSLSTRLAANLLIFVLLARLWGSETFGAFMYPFVVTTILGLAVDYGYGIQVVKDIGKDETALDAVMARAFLSKLLLFGLTAIVAVAIALTDRESTLVFCLLFLGAAANSFAMLFNYAIRALGRFARESGNNIVLNVLPVVMVTAAAVWGYGPLGVAIALLLARILGFGFSYWVYMREVGPLELKGVSRHDVVVALKEGFPFGVYMTLSVLYLQLDTLLIKHLIGSASVGVYQSGIRILMAGLIFADAINSAFLQRLSGLIGERSKFMTSAKTMVRWQLFFGTCGLIVFNHFGQALVHLIYGEGYRELYALMPLIGIVLWLRYWGSGWGLQLTISNQQSKRVLILLGSLLGSLALNLLLIPRLGLQGALYTSIAMHLMLNAAFGVFAWGEFRVLSMQGRSWLLVGLAVVVIGSFLAHMNSAVVGTLALLVCAVIGISPEDLRRKNKQENTATSTQPI
jgi:O-antigen/teichoic acid export membrane protein